MIGLMMSCVSRFIRTHTHNVEIFGCKEILAKVREALNDAQDKGVFNQP